MADRPPCFLIDPMTISGISTETSLLATTVPANSITREGTVITVTAQGIGSTGPVAPTLKWRLRVGKSTLAGAVAQLQNINAAVSQTNKPWRVVMDLIFRDIGAAGQVIVGGWCWNNLSPSVATANNGETSTNTVAFDTTIDRDIELSAQWSTVDAGNILVCHLAKIELETP